MVGGSSAWDFLSNFLQGKELVILNAQLFHIHYVNLTWTDSMETSPGKHTPSLSKSAAGFLEVPSFFFIHTLINTLLDHGEGFLSSRDAGTRQ